LRERSDKVIPSNQYPLQRLLRVARNDNPSYSNVNRPGIEIAGSLQRVEGPGDATFLARQAKGFVEAIVAPKGVPTIAGNAFISKL
jgi:hypothetical protein